MQEILPFVGQVNVLQFKHINGLFGLGFCFLLCDFVLILFLLPLFGGVGLVVPLNILMLSQI